LIISKTLTIPSIACTFSACGIGEATSKAGFHWVSWWYRADQLDLLTVSRFPEAYRNTLKGEGDCVVRS
jgi:hypothetical protein